MLGLGKAEDRGVKRDSRRQEGAFRPDSQHTCQFSLSAESFRNMVNPPKHNGVKAERASLQGKPEGCTHEFLVY